MRVGGIIGGGLVALIGLVWSLQGVNSQIAPQSFMTGSRTWLVIGIVTMSGGIALMVRSWRRPSP